MKHRAHDDGTETWSFFVRNEFAMVELEITKGPTAQTLHIRNAETDEVVRLDPLELEALTRLAHRAFGPLIVFE